MTTTSCRFEHVPSERYGKLESCSSLYQGALHLALHASQRFIPYYYLNLATVSWICRYKYDTMAGKLAVGKMPDELDPGVWGVAQGQLMQSVWTWMPRALLGSSGDY